MSIERDLLKRVISEDDDFFVIYDLYKEIYELLAQPEHIPDVGNMVEPVAWMQDSVELYVLEEKSAIRGYVIPLYTAPPKREPLSEDAVGELLMGGFSTHLMDLVRMIEKAHGITGVDDE